MDADFVIFDDRFTRAVATFSMLSGKSFEEELLNQGRLFITDVIKVTPPFHQGVGQNASVAKKAGEMSLGRNMDRIFEGKDLKGSRQITHLFGRTDVPGLPFVVPTKEKYPDVQGIYDQKKSEAKARAMRGMRMWGPPVPVSKVKIRRIYNAERKKVGWLAGGWNAAASRLGSKVPAFVKRHGAAPGQVIVDFRKTYLRLTLINQVKYANHVGGLEKRASFAHSKRIHAMQKQIPRLMREHAKVLA